MTSGNLSNLWFVDHWLEKRCFLHVRPTHARAHTHTHTLHPTMPEGSSRCQQIFHLTPDKEGSTLEAPRCKKVLVLIFGARGIASGRRERRGCVQQVGLRWRWSGKASRATLANGRPELNSSKSCHQARLPSKLSHLPAMLRPDNVPRLRHRVQEAQTRECAHTGDRVVMSQQPRSQPNPVVPVM